MSEWERQRLPRIQGVAAFRKGDIYAMPAVPAAYRTSKPRSNPYTSPEMLGRIYSSSIPYHTTDRAASTYGCAVHVGRLRGVPAGSWAVPRKDLHRSPPHHLMPLASSYPAPVGYFTDALHFAQVVEESQRTAIKFEERRYWLRLLDHDATRARRTVPTSQQPRLLAWEAESPRRVETPKPPMSIMVAYESVPPVPESNLKIGSQHILSLPRLRVLRQEKSYGITKNGIHTHTDSVRTVGTAAGKQSWPSLFLADEQLPRLPAEEAHLPTLPVQFAGPPRLIMSTPDDRDAGDLCELREQEAPPLKDTLFAPCPIPASTSRGCSKPTSVVAPLSAFMVEAPVRCAVAHDDSRTPLKTPPAVGAPRDNKETSAHLDTRYTERLLDAPRSADAHKSLQELQSPQLTAQEEGLLQECTSMKEEVHSSEGVTFADPAELCALRTAEATALVSSLFLTTSSPLPRMGSGEATSVKSLADATVLTEDEATANSPSSVPPARTPRATQGNLKQLRWQVSRSVVDSILACTAAVDSVPMYRLEMYSAYEVEEPAIAVTLFQPPLPLQTFLEDHHASALLPPAPSSADKGDLYQLRHQLAHELVTLVTQSTHTT
ncbi:hypothetical protein NXY56_002459 [Leishmania guyanensis]|uniref:Uncharacterized protein n=1 Tax=Leishmania guyanensis TaxID=5670 RepID=A0A1E1ITE2_LEIGU|nr:hypothetical protein, unknown function [Leishmania guyanensis]